MTRSEREQHIERYLSGQMNPADEQDFFIQAALDRELRYELKALMTVDSAIRKERDAEPAEHTALRTRVAAMLAAAPVPEQPAPASVPHTPAPIAGSAIQKFLTLQWLSFAAATIALTAVIFLLAERPAAQEPPRNPAGYPAPYGQTGASPSLKKDGAGPATLGTERGATIQTPANTEAVEEAGIREDVSGRGPTPQAQAPSSAAGRATERQGTASLREHASTRSDASGSRTTSNRTSEGSSERTSVDQSESEEEEAPAIAPRKRKGDSIAVGVKIKLKTP